MIDLDKRVLLLFVRSVLLIISFWAVCLGPLLWKPACAAPVAMSSPAAPSFSLRDANQNVHSLAEFRHKPVALFFFCGCDACRRCGSLWAQAQQDETATSRPGPSPPTLIVFSGDAASARAFMAETGLNPKTTTLLFDPREKVADAFGVTLCPRIFVVDPGGRLRYTNNEPGSNPQTTPAAVFVSRALTALRALPKPQEQSPADLPHPTLKARHAS